MSVSNIHVTTSFWQSAHGLFPFLLTTQFLDVPPGRVVKQYQGHTDILSLSALSLNC
jgi:hypothetical protein